MKIELKSSAKKRFIAFGKSTKPLGELSEQQLAEFALIVRESGRKDYAAFFEHLPTVAELKKTKVDAAIEPVAGAATTEQASIAASVTPQSIGITDKVAPAPQEEPAKKK